MPINAHPEYIQAEKEFLAAQTDEEKLVALENMVKKAPSHKGAETLRINLKMRYKKLKEKLRKEQIKAKSRGKQQQGIKKLDMQAILLGFTNSGKSSIFNALTGADAEIASYGFTTKESQQAIMNHKSTQVQIIDLPPVGSENFDRSLIATTDTILIIVEKVHEISELLEILKKSKAKQIVVFNKIDLHDETARRKIYETLRSRRYNFSIVSAKTGEGLEELKDKILKSFDKIRIYTKQPEQEQADDKPMILPPNSTVEDVARKILGSYVKDIKKTRIWGPSSKFAGQVVGLKHVLKDKDTIEFQTK